MWETVWTVLDAVWPASLVGTGLILAGVALGWWVGGHEGTPVTRAVAWWLRRVVRPLLARDGWPRRFAIIAGNNAAVCLVAVLIGGLGQLVPPSAAAHVLNQLAWIAVGGIGVGLGAALRMMLPRLTFVSPERPADTSSGRDTRAAAHGEHAAPDGERDAPDAEAAETDDERAAPSAEPATHADRTTTHERFPAAQEAPPGAQAARPGRPWAMQIGFALNLIEVPAIMLTAGLCLSQGAWRGAIGLDAALTTYAAVVVPMLIVSAAGEALWMKGERLSMSGPLHRG